MIIASVQSRRSPKQNMAQVVPETVSWGSPKSSQLDVVRSSLDDDVGEEGDGVVAETDDACLFFEEMERNIHRNLALGLLAADVPEAVPGRARVESIDSVARDSIGGRARFSLDDSFVDDVVKKELPPPVATVLPRAASARLSTVYDRPPLGEQPSHVTERSSRESPTREATSSTGKDVGARNAGDGRATDDDGEGAASTTTHAAAAATKETTQAADPPSFRASANGIQKLGSSRLTLVHTNSTGSLHIDSTLSDPDFKATIECVCRALHAFLTRPTPHFPPTPKNLAPTSVFEDQNAVQKELNGIPPTLKELTRFMRSVYKRGEMHVECLVTAFIYVERLLKAYRGALALQPTNWRPIVFSALILASKICDDESPLNADWCYVCSSFTVQRINELELALLKAFQFKPTVSASQYARSYFHFRSMAARIGIIQGDTVKPLDVTVAKRIAAASRAVATKPHRAASPEVQQTPLAQHRSNSFRGLKTATPTRRPNAAIEQVVDMSPDSRPHSSSAHRHFTFFPSKTNDSA